MFLHHDVVPRPVGGCGARRRSPRLRTRCPAVATCSFIALTAIAFALALPAPALAQRQSGIQLGLDGSTVLVSKDIGAERWAIAFSTPILSGNVYPQNGGTPKFVWCELRGVSGAGDLMFSCYGAESCTVGACGEPAWVFIADVTLPTSFFQLPAGAVASGVSPGAGPPGAGGRIGG